MRAMRYAIVAVAVVAVLALATASFLNHDTTTGSEKKPEDGALGATRGPAPEAAGLSVTKAELKKGLLTVEGANAAPGAVVHVDSAATTAVADDNGRFRVELEGFSTLRCTVTVSDRAGSVDASLSDCPTPPTLVLESPCGPANVPLHYQAEAWHPNKAPLAFVVDWGDGTTTRDPPTGFHEGADVVTSALLVHEWTSAGEAEVTLSVVDENGLGASTAFLVSVSGAGDSVNLTVLCDTGTGANAQANVAQALRECTQGLVGLGDYYYEAPPETWRAIFQPLTDRGSYLVRGNHDERAALHGLLPGSPSWSRHVNGVLFVGIDAMTSMAPGSDQHAEVRAALCNAAEPVRILVMHHPWWLENDARHPGSEFPASAEDMDALVQDCGVDLVLAAHEHNYQRMVRGEVSYAIVGTGGRPLYPLEGLPPDTLFAAQAFGRLVLEVHSEGFTGAFVSLEGHALDTFSYRVPPST